MATFTMTTGVDHFVGTTSADTFAGAANSWGADDTIDGGTTAWNTISVSGGTFDFRTLASITHIDGVDIGSGTNTVWLWDGVTTTVGVSGGATTVYGGSGQEIFTVDAKTVAVSAGSGDDTVEVPITALHSTLTLTGGAGYDTLLLFKTGTNDITALGGLSGFEEIRLSTKSDVLVVDQAVLAGVQKIAAGGGTDDLRTAAATLDLSQIDLDLQKISTTNSGGTAFTLANAQLRAASGSLRTITGTGSDNSILTAGTVFDLTGMTLSNIQVIKTLSTVGTVITGTSDAHVMTGGSGADTLIGAGGADQLTGGAGADIFRGTAAQLSTATITDFSMVDTINITDVASAGATVQFSGGVLTVKSGGTTVAQVALTGTFTDHFQLVANGGGLSVTYAGAPVQVSSSDSPSPTFGTVVRATADGSGLPLVGTTGNENFTGSSDPAKTDTVIENGTKFSQNVITRNADGSITITGPNGSDHLVGVERIIFDDGVLILDLPSEQANPIISLYKVLFDRTPDEAGIKWQVNTVKSGAGIDTIASIFLASPEAGFIKLGNLSNADFINQLYDNAFDRKADAGGVQYWLDVLEYGASRESLALFFVQSAEQVELVGQANKAGVFSAYPEAG